MQIEFHEYVSEWTTLQYIIGKPDSKGAQKYTHKLLLLVELVLMSYECVMIPVKHFMFK